MYYRNRNREFDLKEMLGNAPNAIAYIQGGSEYREINGRVSFHQTPLGVLVSADIYGLPVSDIMCDNDIFAFHIHEGSSCGGNNAEEFADSGTHFNPENCPHPYHAGDMPPLFAAGRRAFLAFLTDRFTVSEIVGKTVIIHSQPDDFSTQPSGNAGVKIACGEIKAS